MYIPIFRATLVCAALLVPTAAALAAPDHFDIVGLKLGMTEQQVREALRAHNPQLQITAKNLSYTYSDGVQQLQTPPALSELVASQLHGEAITLQFSLPPQPARLVGVRRIAPLQNPPTHDQLVKSVLQKYGAPATHIPFKGGNSFTRMVWAEPGRPQCWRTSPQQAAGFVAASPVLDVLKQFADRQKRGLAPTDLSQCGASAQFAAQSDPVRTLSMEMTDTGPWVSSLQATQRWLAQLEADARKARVGTGTTPRL